MLCFSFCSQSVSAVGASYIKGDIDTIGGNSGSPVYLYDSSGNKTVIAIHGYGDIGYGNYGVRIDTDILHFAYNNPHLQ